MPLQDEDVQTLTGLGLTTLQAKLYLTMVKTGKTTVKQISNASNVARQEVQRVTAELLNLGLVERILGNPTEFQPLSINDAMSFLLQRRAKITLELEERANQLLKNFKSNQPESQNDEEPQFIVTTGKKAIEKGRDVINRTTRVFDLISGGSWKNIWYTSSVYKEQNIQALKRKVKMRIVTEKFPDKRLVYAAYKHALGDPNFEIRFIPFSIPVTLGIYDKRELLVPTSTLKLLGDSPMLWTNNPSLVTAVQSYFDQLWKQATGYGMASPDTKTSVR
jgi:sugar-specific transcriptional regulator TrmB